MKKARGYKENITYLGVLKISKWFMLFMPVIIPFYECFHLSMKEILILQSVYSISMLALEIPSGYAADMLGRRVTLLLGGILGFAGFTIYIFADSFWYFLIAEIILGAGMSFISGSDSAMLYDSLVHLKKQNDYAKYEGRISAIGNFAEAIAGIAGGALALYFRKAHDCYGYHNIFILQSIVALLAVPSALLLTEPERTVIKQKNAWNNIFKISEYSLIKNHFLRNNIIFSALTGSATLTMAWFVQKIFLENKITNEFILGILWTALNVSVGIFTLFAFKVDKKLGQINTMILIAVLIGLCYVFLKSATGYIAMMVIFIFYFARGIATPVLKDYINRITVSEVRATVLSLRSFIIRIIFATTSPLMGWITDCFNIGTALCYAGIFYFTLSVFFIIKVKKLQNKIQIESILKEQTRIYTEDRHEKIEYIGY